MNRTWWKLLVLGGVALVAAELILSSGKSGSRVPAGAQAPAFSLPDVNGHPVSLESLKGRVVALNFWATWCGPCREEIPDLARLYAARGGKCFELLGVAEESGSRDEVVAVASKLGVNYPILLDERGAVGDAFRIPGYPRTYLIDGEGRIRRVFEGAVDREDLDRALSLLLSEPSVSCPKA